MVFSTNGLGPLDICMPGSYFITHTKMNSTWITNLNVRAKVIKTHGRKFKSKSVWLLVRLNLLTQKAKGIKGRKRQINWTSPKLKICMLQRMLLRRKIQSTDYDKISANQVSGKGLVYTTYKEPLQLNKNSIFKWTKNLKRQFSKKDIQMTNQHMKSTISQ